MAKPRTALITGASGMLGREIVSAFDAAGWTTFGTAFSRPDEKRKIFKVDLTDRSSFLDLLDKLKPDVIVHSAANRYPEGVAGDPTSGLEINVQATRMIAAEAASRDVFLVYISTDFVFPGRLAVPVPIDSSVDSTIPKDQSVDGWGMYTITDDPEPINGYGLTKRLGEIALDQVRKAKFGHMAVGQSDPKRPISVSLRVPLLYGAVSGTSDPSRNNIHGLADQIIREAKQVKHGDAVATIRLDDVLIRYPTWTGDVGRVCEEVCSKYTGPIGDVSDWPVVLQFSSQVPTTKYGMGSTFCRIFGFDQSGFKSEHVDSVSIATSDLPIRLIPDRSKYTPELSHPTGPKSSKSSESASTVDQKLLVSCDRPVHVRLDLSALQSLGINTSAVSFDDWWRRELRAYRH